MAENPNFTPITEDTAANKLSSTGEAPNYQGGYYGEATFEGGGGWEQLSESTTQHEHLDCAFYRQSQADLYQEKPSPMQH